jgi:hypothetical protein
MADERNFIDKAQSISQKRIGRDLSPSEMATEFSRWGIEERIKYLDAIEGELTPNEPLSIEAAARRHAYQRALRSTHERLRKIDR